MRRSGQTLTDDQYNTLDTLISSINTEASNLVNISGINNAINIANGKNTAKLRQVTLQDLTTMINSINSNSTYLNSISASFDTINNTLTGIVDTTPAAITTTQAAISN